MPPKPSPSRPNLYRRLRRSQELEALQEATVDLVSGALEARDQVIASHCARVEELAGRLATKLALDRRGVELVRKAGAMHDLGVIGVRDDILNKPGPLDADEWEIIRRHPDIGADLMAWHPALAAATPIVRHHHERRDGSGYPAGLKGEVIPIASRILAVAESFDTMTNRRIYRDSAVSPVNAVRDISEHSGSWYDPAVVDALGALHR